MLASHRAARPRSLTLASARRSFSWRTKRGSPRNPSIYQSSISYAVPTKGRPILCRNYFWKRGHFLNQYTQSPEWRLLSSWGKGNNDTSPSGQGRPPKNSDQSPEYDWYGEFQKRHAESLRHFEDFKEMIDRDPYAAIFGRRSPVQDGKHARESCSESDNHDVKPAAPRPGSGRFFRSSKLDLVFESKGYPGW